MKTKFLTPILCLCLVYAAQSQNFSIKTILDWTPEPFTYSAMGIYSSEIWTFGGAEHHPDYPNIPIFSERFKVSGQGALNVEVLNMVFEPMEKAPSDDDQYLGEDITFQTKIEQNRHEYFGTVSFIPIRMSASGQYERLTSVELNVVFTPTNNGNSGFAPPPPPPPGTYTSALSDGEVFKIAVTENGVHKIDQAFLKDKLGINIESVDPRTIKIYGNGGGMLPRAVNQFRYDDLEENAIQVVGEEDGSFDAGDFILFYGEGPDKWSYNTNKETFNLEKNVYDDRNFYFLKISSGNGLRVSLQNSIATTAYTTNSFDDYLHFEEDRVNLLYDASGSQGSGTDWYGDVFNPTRERNYTDFSFPNVISSEPANVEVIFAGRSPVSSSFAIEVNGQSFSSGTIGSISWGNNESTYAKTTTINTPFQANSENISVTVKYPGVGDQRNLGWLDHIELNARRALTFVGNQMGFRDVRTTEHSNSTFELSGANSNTTIWDISDPLKPRLQETVSSGNQLSFGVNTSSLKQFIAFNNSDGFLSPTEIGKVDPQNLHAIDNIDFLIVYHPAFESMAQQLADHRKAYNNMSVAMAPIDQVYNEFSSGRLDPTAIRDFSKLLYERNPQFKFLLLFGDGSFDHKDVYGFGKNFIPTFQTTQTLNPITAYPADDYFTLLSPNEGVTLDGDMDIAVGRLPVTDGMEAQEVVNKIIHYDSSPETLGDWRNRILFTADDEDGNRHLLDADSIARTISRRHEVFNEDKVYFDAFQQISTAGGTRFPKAQEALNQNIFKGVLVTNYLGHGGSTGWAQERVLTKDDIDSWSNFDRPTLFVTATCSFTGYDDPTTTTAGELAMLKEDGGAIALFTTVRAVYASQNFKLTKAVFDTLFQLDNNVIPSLGEILRIAKNNNTAIDVNSRKFTLIGDPAQQLAIPRYGIATSKINDRAIAAGQPDTLRALQKVTIEGFVHGDDGSIMTDFNGKVYPTLYDKAVNVTTLSQDSGSPAQQFSLQKNILFKGVASVTNGAFKFTFVVPKDINYTFGYGKLSYYAEDGTSRDARGFYSDVIIGGTDPNAIIDDEGPLVEVFMNTEDFVLGGLTNDSPTLLVKLSDDNGINVVGNSIGHDLIGVLDEQTQNTYILNDFYESKLDDFTQGEVRFPLFDLEEGLHRINVKAWDVSNNSGEGYTEFVVFNSEEAALDHVLNYPNPFTTSTNFQFEHNLQGQQLDVMIQIFTVAGNLVKTIESNITAVGDRVTDIHWDGKDDYGDRLGRGVYVYKVKVMSPGLNDQALKTESEFEKLVILK